ncbi:nitrophenyl compound nitroreductase subunit ArsF family protein [Alistipes muris]|uniref:nitrophenyl compound nitroreductase subunit ArsF family protein n=1 Tax=Alistipes muris TaxID=2941326 RepID=UPI00203E6A50|nr:nitrophenyl compound nitroreductase subunit ArsF family protein [Alistipes muris]MCX4282543.1 nitrophenyl compound nitroreductase subunit ArsF family protein [Alistipes sp.]
MKKRLIPLLSAVFLACGQSPKNQSIGEQTMTDGVEVLSFHAKKRCPTCVAIEQLTREVIETEFAAQLADGSLALRVTDITENEALANKYEIAWSSLLVNHREGGKERVRNLTQFAFANARTNPDKFKAGLKTEIEKLLAE